jgi:uncharacterized membrane protein required for colicin V production
MIDLLLLAILAGVAWCVAGEGAWGAVLTCLAVIFAGLLAMNYFEPLAAVLEKSLPISWASRVDFIALVVLFGVLTTLIRVGTDYIAPTMIDVHPAAYHAVRWGFGALTGYITMAILLTALHTAPLPRTFLGFKPERPNFFGAAAPDQQWLAFTQHVSEDVFVKREIKLDDQRNRHEIKRIFDGLVYWLPTREPTYVQLPTFAIRYASRRERVYGSGDGKPARPAGNSPGIGPGGGGGGPTSAAPAF